MGVDDFWSDDEDFEGCNPLSGAIHDGEEQVRIENAVPALLEALEEVMEWIDNWTPDFVQEDGWEETGAKVEAAIAMANSAKEHPTPVPVGWQYRAWEGGSPTAWYSCDERTAGALRRREDYELRQVFVLEAE